MTGWDEFFGGDKFFKDYPIITEEVCHYLKSSGKKGAGFDVISPDPVSAKEFTRHKILLSGEDFVIIENLTGLDALGSGLVVTNMAQLKAACEDPESNEIEIADEAAVRHAEGLAGLGAVVDDLA